MGGQRGRGFSAAAGLANFPAVMVLTRPVSPSGAKTYNLQEGGQFVLVCEHARIGAGLEVTS